MSRSKLTLNLGLRYEYTTPVGGGAVLDVKDWSDFCSYGEPAGFMNFDPTVPNPKFGGILGSTVYTGNCPECTGKGAFDSYKKAFAPRRRPGVSGNARHGDSNVRRQVLRRGQDYRRQHSLPGADSEQHVLRGQFAACFQYWNIDAGLPAWTPPPFRGPATDAGGSTYLWQNPDSGRPPEFYSWNLDIQRQLPKNLVAFDRLHRHQGHAPLLGDPALNQMDPKYFNQYGRDLLNSSATSPAAVAAGIRLPYPGSTGRSRKRSGRSRIMAPWRPTTPRWASAPATRPTTP